MKTKSKVEILNEIAQDANIKVHSDEQCFKAMEKWSEQENRKECQNNHLAAITLIVLVIAGIITMFWIASLKRSIVTLNGNIETYSKTIVKQNRLINQFYDFDNFAKTHSNKEVSAKIKADKNKRVNEMKIINE